MEVISSPTYSSIKSQALGPLADLIGARSRAPWASGRHLASGGKGQTVVQRRETEMGLCAFQGPEEDLEKFREDTAKHGVP